MFFPVAPWAEVQPGIEESTLRKCMARVGKVEEVRFLPQDSLELSRCAGWGLKGTRRVTCFEANAYLTIGSIGRE